MTHRLRLIKPRPIGVSPAGVEYVARYMGDAAILRARLDAAWARHTAKKGGAR